MKINKIITYDKFRKFAGFQIQQGINLKTATGKNIFLMSVRKDAKYKDQISKHGTTIVYEGHDRRRSSTCKNPDKVDQPRKNKSGALTPNGITEMKALEFKNKKHGPLKIFVFSKIKKGLWNYCGVFNLVDVAYVKVGPRKVFRFTLKLVKFNSKSRTAADLKHDRVIPSDIQAFVYNRDKGKCVECGATKNLHFDHILHYSKGGTSKNAENIRILCARHNLTRGNRFK